VQAKVMKKQLVIIGIVILLVCVGLSGCNQISNVFLTDEEKLVGTWNSEGIWLDVPIVIVFSSNGTFKATFKLGIPTNSAIDFSSSKGKWDINDGILSMEIVDVIPPTNYTYQFSEDSRTLTITDIDSSDSYVLRKQ
jgi:hypothetical protein